MSIVRFLGDPRGFTVPVCPPPIGREQQWAQAIVGGKTVWIDIAKAYVIEDE